MKKLFPFLAIALAVLIAYAPAVGAGFVWDDTALVLRDPLIRSPQLIGEGFAHFLFTDATASDFYRPIQRLTYTLEYWAFAVRPAPYHVTSILCHVAAAIALLLLARSLLARFNFDQRKRGIVALVATSAWALHPLHSGAVAYVSGRADPLAATFGFLGLYFALKTERAERYQAWAFGVLAGVLFLFSALSKESGLIFPVLWGALLLIEHNWRGLVRWSAVAAAVVIAYFSLRTSAEHVPAPMIHSPAPALVRPILVSRAFAEYAGLLVLPLNLHVERDVETRPNETDPTSPTNAAWRELETLAGLVLLGAFIWWAWRARTRSRAVFTLLILALITYAPVSGVFPLNATIAEHWIYLPSAFLLVAAAAAIAGRITSRRSASVTAAIVSVWLIFLGVRTFLRTFDWKDQRTFFERTIAAGGDSARMLIDLAIVDMNENKLDAAQKLLERALAQEPNHPIATFNLAAVAVKKGDHKRAHALLDRAASMEIVEAQAQELRAVLKFKETGETDLLRMHWASRTGPPNWSIEKRYIKVLAESGRMSDAIAETQATLKRESYRAETWQLLGELLQKTGNDTGAAAALEQARDYDVHLDLRPKVL